MNPLLDTAPFWAELPSFGDRPALITPAGTVTYAGLASRVAELVARLGTTRRLVVIEGGNDVDTVVAYLAALSGRHPAVLAPSAEAVASYDPDVVIRAGSLVERRSGTAHDLHPDLALLLSTSGSTGSPKLVRLSHANLTSNTAAIVSYLQIRSADVAPTTLPLHYCFGLSVLNSHLAVGAAVLVTEESVTSADFWEAFRAAGCTTLAGVPYTFDLLDRVGFTSMDLPSLRYLTQAGGRLDPATVRRYAERGQQRGFDLIVMYGQTEATARMAYLPPDLALSCAGAVGTPVPGGSFSLAADGELIYSGDNVMLGYALTADDLARGRDVTELRTGDLARLRPDGLFEITGRKCRFAKVFGLRIDLERVERVLASEGLMVHCADGGDRVVVAVDVSSRPAPSWLADRAAEAAGLPVGAIQLLPLNQVPRLASGKPDYQAIVDSSHEFHRIPCETRASPVDLERLFAHILRRDHVTPDDSFVSLQGDSLSYVEMSVRLEEALGTLPANWHTTPIRDLTTTRGKRRWGRSLETNVLLRAIAIVLIVGSHADLFMLLGGAHVLLGVVGYNFARFFLTDSPRLDRVRHLTGSIARIAVPAMVWCALAMSWDPEVTWRNVMLVNGIIGPRGWDDSWHYWFIEAVVYTLAGLAVLLAVPGFDRLERRWPFWLPMGLAVVALLTRYDVVELRGGDHIHRATVVFWLFALGWATAKATRPVHRLLISGVVVATVPGFFEQGERTVVVIVGTLLLVWLRSVRIPTFLAAPVGTLAGASLYIYLSHWQIYPYVERGGHYLLATVVSLAAGTVLWALVTRLPEIRRPRIRAIGYRRTAPRNSRAARIESFSGTRPRVVHASSRALKEIVNNLRWLHPRRYVSDPRIQRTAARPRRDDKPAHVTA
jgi:acyl-CoA synthetase (AMP-forming)/AMP-acid ligase II